MCCRNLSSSGAPSPKVEEKTLLFSSHVRRPRGTFLDQVWHLQLESLAKDLHQVLKPNNIGTLNATDIAKRRVKHHPFRHCLSRFLMKPDIFNGHCTYCTVHCTMEDFHANLWITTQIGTVRYHYLCMKSCVEAECPRSWNGDCVWSALKSSVRIPWTVNGKIIAKQKQDWHLPILSILFVPTLGAFLV